MSWASRYFSWWIGRGPGGGTFIAPVVPPEPVDPTDPSNANKMQWGDRAIMERADDTEMEWDDS